MHVQINKEFWNKSNWLAKLCLKAGFYLVDLGMKLNGLEQAPTKKATR